MYFIFCMVILIFPRAAYAYLDPGAGNAFLALLLGGTSGLVVCYHLLGARIRRLFSSSRKNSDKQ